MVFCTNCGVDIEEHNKFCPKCGNKVEKTHTSEEDKKGVLNRLDIESEDIDQVTETAKKSLGRLGRFARKRLERGVELASQGIEVAKETIDERMSPSDSQAINIEQEKSIKFCPFCGKALELSGKFCNHCGEKLDN
jgi:rRNA maturation endonuclease Nob1